MSLNQDNQIIALKWSENSTFKAKKIMEQLGIPLNQGFYLFDLQEVKYIDTLKTSQYNPSYMLRSPATFRFLLLSTKDYTIKLFMNDDDDRSEETQNVIIQSILEDLYLQAEGQLAKPRFEIVPIMDMTSDEFSSYIIDDGQYRGAFKLGNVLYQEMVKKVMDYYHIKPTQPFHVWDFYENQYLMETITDEENGHTLISPGMYSFLDKIKNGSKNSKKEVKYYLINNDATRWSPELYLDPKRIQQELDEEVLKKIYGSIRNPSVYHRYEVITDCEKVRSEFMERTFQRNDSSKCEKARIVKRIAEKINVGPMIAGILNVVHEDE